MLADKRQHYMRKRYLYLSLTLFLSYLLSISVSSCEKATINIGSDFVTNSPTTLVYTDTVTTHIATIYVDSFVTSAPNTLLVGNYVDPEFGSVASRSFVQLGLPANAIIPPGSVYDSIEIVLKFKKSYYGDTTRPYTVTINQLSAPIVLPPTQSSFYNKDSCSYDPTVLGSTQLPNIRPATLDTIAITLRGDSIGRDLFTKFTTGAPEIQNNGLFVNYFKGLMISGNSSNSLVTNLGDSVEMRLHYHTPGITATYTYLAFDMINQPYEFNNIMINRTGSAIASLGPTNKELASSSTGNAGYGQYVTGSMVKISFPYLRNVLQLPNYIKIVKAILLVKPVKNSFSQLYQLPTEMTLSATDGLNQIGQLVSEGSLFTDGLTGSGTGYTYDVTNYLLQQIQVPDNSSNYGLLLLPTNETQVFNRIVVGDARQPLNYTTEVQIYYAAVQ